MVGYKSLEQQIRAAISDAGPGHTRVQVTIYYGRDATLSHSVTTTHQPGGYIARGGEHFDLTWTHGDPDLPDMRPSYMARSAIQRVHHWAYENLAAPI